MRRFMPAVVTLLILMGLVLAACTPEAASTATPAVPVSATETIDPKTPAYLTLDALNSITPAFTATPPATATPTATHTPSPSPTPQPSSTPIPPSANAANVSKFPDPKGYTWSPVFSGLERLTDLADAGDGRMLALEQPGRIRLIVDGSVVDQPFMDIVGRVGSQGNEQGLLGIALHPKYAENGLLYVNYNNPDGTTIIARYQASSDRTQADPATEKILLTADQPYANHNGGAMVFGPDGYLYIGLGDGGSGGDPQGNGQKVTTLLGKILRVDVDNGDPYAIPTDNPFADGQQGRAEIWALGLRNPWRFSFDRASGDVYIGDVGQNQWEEIDYLPAGSAGGANFGWNFREGANAYQGEPPAGLQLVEPVAQYQHPEGCSVTGGYVYRGEALPELSGIYLYGDFCNGRIWGLLHHEDGSWENKVLFDSGAFVTSFAQDLNGELYLLDQRAGAALKLVKSGD
jgi:glucose/arabinose dehydrogenase